MEVKIKENLNQVQKLIEQEVSIEDIDGMIEYLMELKCISGLSASNLANAKVLWRNEQRERILEIVASNDDIKKLPASTINDLIKSYCGEYEALYEKADRLDKRLSYAMEGLRTAISARKTELEKSI